MSSSGRSHIPIIPQWMKRGVRSLIICWGRIDMAGETPVVSSYTGAKKCHSQQLEAIDKKDFWPYNTLVIVNEEICCRVRRKINLSKQMKILKQISIFRTTV